MVADLVIVTDRAGFAAAGFADVTITPSHPLADGLTSAIVQAHISGPHDPVRPHPWPGLR